MMVNRKNVYIHVIYIAYHQPLPTQPIYHHLQKELHEAMWQILLVA